MVVFISNPEQIKNENDEPPDDKTIEKVVEEEIKFSQEETQQMTEPIYLCNIDPIYYDSVYENLDKKMSLNKSENIKIYDLGSSEKILEMFSEQIEELTLEDFLERHFT